MEHNRSNVENLIRYCFPVKNKVISVLVVADEWMSSALNKEWSFARKITDMIGADLRLGDLLCQLLAKCSYKRFCSIMVRRHDETRTQLLAIFLPKHLDDRAA
jgi:hypothetical protein